MSGEDKCVCAVHASRCSGKRNHGPIAATASGRLSAACISTLTGHATQCNARPCRISKFRRFDCSAAVQRRAPLNPPRRLANANQIGSRPRTTRRKRTNSGIRPYLPRRLITSRLVYALLNQTRTWLTRPGLIRFLKSALETSRAKGETKSATLCWEGATYVNVQPWDRGWGCGCVPLFITARRR